LPCFVSQHSSGSSCEALTAAASSGLLVMHLPAAGDALVEGMLQNILEQHELDAAKRRRALDEAIASLPPQVLLESNSHALLSKYSATRCG
jgi:hypothetical protein